MQSFNNSYRVRLPARARGPIFAVGRRVYVASQKDRPAHLTSTDDGAGALTTLMDGTEVEILAWRPRSSGTRYRVRSTPAGIEGWLAAGSVRCAEFATAASGREAAIRNDVPPRAPLEAIGRRTRRKP